MRTIKYLRAYQILKRLKYDIETRPSDLVIGLDEILFAIEELETLLAEKNQATDKLNKIKDIVTYRQ